MVSKRFSMVEYIWQDGATPVQWLRCKTRAIPYVAPELADINSFPMWNYDGSSTYQATGHDSDLIIKPVSFITDPIRGEGNYLVMTEVFNGDGTPHRTNHRAELRRVMDAGGAKCEPWIGFEQEYTFYKGRTPLGWPDGGYPAPQGPFYCGLGADVAFGREIAEVHMRMCLESGLAFCGINAEVMPGQWEFQIGYRGVDEKADPLTMADHLHLARWILNRVAEDYDVNISTDCKPIKGDWNGAGLHTNFSTIATRQPGSGIQAIRDAIKRLESKHDDHIAVYGFGLQERLTGLHETCSIHEFRSGVADRGSSIRIPRHVAEKGSGYFEDRRPGANADPYEVGARLIKTVCNID